MKAFTILGLMTSPGGGPRLDRWARIQFGAGTFWTTYLFVKYIRQTKVSSKMKVKVFEDVEYDKSFHYLNQM